MNWIAVPKDKTGQKHLGPPGSGTMAQSQWRVLTMESVNHVQRPSIMYHYPHLDSLQSKEWHPLQL